VAIFPVSRFDTRRLKRAIAPGIGTALLFPSAWYGIRRMFLSKHYSAFTFALPKHHADIRLTHRRDIFRRAAISTALPLAVDCCLRYVEFALMAGITFAEYFRATVLQDPSPCSM
jgi:hypothetical protein